jgi:hypothetical protein
MGREVKPKNQRYVMNKSKKSQKIAIGVGVFSLVLSANLIAPNPAKALGWSDLVDLVLGQLNGSGDLFQDAVSLIRRELENSEGGQELLDVFDIGAEVLGALGVPIPEEIEQQVAENLPDIDGVYVEDILIDELKRSADEAAVESVLGEEGQKKRKEGIEKIDEIANEIGSLADEANASIVTQEVMKKIAAQNARTAIIQQDLSNTLKSLEVSTNVSNNTLNRIDATTTGQLQKENIEEIQLGGRILKLAAIASAVY